MGSSRSIYFTGVGAVALVILAFTMGDGLVLLSAALLWSAALIAGSIRAKP